MVNTIWCRFDLIRLRKDFCVCMRGGSTYRYLILHTVRKTVILTVPLNRYYDRFLMQGRDTQNYYSFLMNLAYGARFCHISMMNLVHDARFCHISWWIFAYGARFRHRGMANLTCSARFCHMSMANFAYGSRFRHRDMANLASDFVIIIWQFW